MESLQLTASELNIPVLLVDTDSFIFNPLIFQIHIAIFFQFPQLPCRCYTDTECETELFPGDTSIGYFPGVQQPQITLVFRQAVDWRISVYSLWAEH